MNYLASLEHKAMERGKMEGRVEGKIEGRLEGEVNLLKKLLERRFGSLPLFVADKLGQAREDELERWGEAVMTAPTLEAVFQENTLH
jgi:predicted transposase YdaD